MNKSEMILTYSPKHGWHVTDLNEQVLATFANLDEAFAWYSNGGKPEPSENIQNENEHNRLRASGKFWVAYPQPSGSWEADKKVILGGTHVA